MKRFLDCTASDFEKMSKDDLLSAIATSEGRILVCETIGLIQPMLGDVTNAEFVASMGADIILLNIFDVNKPVIQALPKVAPEETIRKLKELTGRPIGINLEPLEQNAESSVETLDMWQLSSGRAATLENAQKAVAMGVDFIVLTGNPGIGVTNTAILDTLKLYREHLGNDVALIAGKMHASGIVSEGGENIITKAGTVDNVTEWGLREFAYEIEDFKKGYYTILDVTCEAKAVAEFDRIARINANVLRHMTIRR